MRSEVSEGKLQPHFALFLHKTVKHKQKATIIHKLLTNIMLPNIILPNIILPNITLPNIVT